MKTFFEDAGHGWLAVKRAELVELGIADKITPYSYQRGATVYLEEDCDLSTYAKALEEKTGVPFREAMLGFKRSYADRSPIRSYQSYQP